MQQLNQELPDSATFGSLTQIKNGDRRGDGHRNGPITHVKKTKQKYQPD